MHYEVITSVYPINCDYCLVLFFCTKNSYPQPDQCIHILRLHFSKRYFNIILLSTPRLPKASLSFRSSYQNSTSIQKMCHFKLLYIFFMNSIIVQRICTSYIVLP